MKKIFCLILCLCLFVSLTFAEPLLERRNYIVEEHSRLSLLIPASLFGYGCYYFIKNPVQKDKEDKKNPQYTYIPAIVLGSISLAFAMIALTPKKTYLIPKLDKDGTIWFQKEIKY